MAGDIHAQLPESAGFGIVIILGFLLMLVAWYSAGIIGMGWAIFMAIIGILMIVFGFVRLGGG